MYTHQKFDW
jgi:hypothetical protein